VSPQFPPIHPCYRTTECPKCGAKPGQFCESMTKTRDSYILLNAHKERRKAYDKAPNHN
jgi:hypothetical protein